MGALGRIWALNDDSELDFERFREAPGTVFEPPGAYFSKFLPACALGTICAIPALNWHTLSQQCLGALQQKLSPQHSSQHVRFLAFCLGCYKQCSPLKVSTAGPSVCGSRASLHNAFIAAVTMLLHLLALLPLLFWCGGLCTAHPPPPVGRAVRARQLLLALPHSACL